ncbi:MFS transporter [Novosphingobium organovorum]|nr:MFS transporter [Novosphingobium organovorum]
MRQRTVPGTAGGRVGEMAQEPQDRGLGPARRRVVLASVVGNGFEWYDFLVYGFLTEAIAAAFFPASDPRLAWLMACAGFSVSFVARPFGGLLLAIYADRHGRKPALLAMIAMMAAGMLLVAITPGYDRIGLAAPLLVLFARVLQGLSVGGEFATASAMLTEWSPPERRMRYGSFQMCAQALAMLLAAVSVLALRHFLSAAQLAQWGWRVPFLVGALIGPVGLYIRHGLGESPQFAPPAPGAAGGVAPLPELFGQARGRLCAGLGVVVIGTASQYVWFIFLPAYVVHQLGLDPASAHVGTGLCALVLLGLTPLVGGLADRLDPWRLFAGAVAVFALLALVLLAQVLARPAMERLLWAQLVCSLPIAFIWGTTPGLLASLFPARMRTSGMALSYNTGVLLFGGMAPFTLSLATEAFDTRLVPAYYIIACAALALGLTVRFWRQDCVKDQGHAART